MHPPTSIDGRAMFHWNDLRYALRLLRRSPLFTLLTVATLAGGLGLSIFTFAFLHRAMVAPLPLPGGDRIVRVEQSTASTGSMFDAVDYASMRRSITTLSEVGAFTGVDVVIGDERHRKVLRAVASEPNLFEVARTRPMLGRTFTSDDQAPGAAPVLVLSEWAWRTAFGGDSAIIGRTTEMNGTFTRVIGVMPPGFGFPVAAEAWMPLSSATLATTAAGTQLVSVYARLADGTDASRAERELARLLDGARRIHPPVAATTLAPAAVTVRSFPMAQFDDEGPYVFALLNLLAILILAIACINVMNLLLARANERARETAVRLALGASRGRLAMQSMWESVLLCVAGGAIATAIAAWGLDAVNAWLQANLPRNLAFWWVWHLDRTAVLSAFAFVTAALAALGAVVAVRASNTSVNAVLRDGGAGAGSRREGRIGRRLVVAQVAAVTSLLFFGVMSGIVAYRVAHLDAGFDTRRLLSASLDLPADRYASRDARASFYARAMDRLGATAALDAPVVRARLSDLSSPVASPRPDVVAPRAFSYAVMGDLRTVGATIHSGRSFDTRDAATSEPVAIVSEALARQYWPGRSPIGAKLRLAADSGVTEQRTIVGVASDVLMGSPFSRDRSAAAVYVPLPQSDASGATFLFRHRADVATTQGEVYAAFADVDARLAPPEMRTYDEIVEKSGLIAVSVTKLFAFCFGFALLLAIGGTYGLMARSIGQRTREIGIRRALGASDSIVVRLLLGQGGRQLGIGVVIALPVMIAVGVGFALNFPVGLVLPIASAIGVAGAILGVVLLATWVPTRRALRITPRDALAAD